MSKTTATPKTAAKKVDPADLPLTLDPTVTEAAFKKQRAAALALKPSEIANLNVQATTAVAIAIAGAANVLRHRAEAETELRNVPWAAIERVAEVGLAMQHDVRGQRAEMGHDGRQATGKALVLDVPRHDADRRIGCVSRYWLHRLPRPRYGTSEYDACPFQYRSIPQNGSSSRSARMLWMISA